MDGTEGTVNSKELMIVSTYTLNYDFFLAITHKTTHTQCCLWLIKCIIETTSSRVLLMLGALGDKSKAELGSYMALAEDEEIGRSEKDSPLRQKKEICCYTFKLTSE